MVRILPVDELLRVRRHTKREEQVSPQSVGEKFAEKFLGIESSHHLDSSYPTTSFSATQKIQFARAIGLEVSLVSYSKLEDLLMKARVGSGGQPVTLRYPAGRSPFPSVAGSSMSICAASWSVNSLPSITPTEGINVVVSGDLLEEPSSSRQADAGLLMGPERKEKPGMDSLKTL